MIAKRSCPGARGRSRWRCGPERRAADRLLELGARHARGRADVEAHRDVGAELGLDARGELRREALGAAVVDRAERDAVVVGGDQRVAEREDLEAARVGEDRAVPRHERVQAAELGDHVLARAGSAGGTCCRGRSTRRARAARRGRRAFTVALRADGHERRRRHVAVRGVEDAGARGPSVAVERRRRSRGLEPVVDARGELRVALRVRRQAQLVLADARELRGERLRAARGSRAVSRSASGAARTRRGSTRAPARRGRARSPATRLRCASSQDQHRIAEGVEAVALRDRERVEAADLARRRRTPSRARGASSAAGGSSSGARRRGGTRSRA